MSLIHNLKYSLFRRLDYIKKIQIWRKYGDETRYHFNDTDIAIGAYTYGIPKITKYDNHVKLVIGKYCSIANDVRILLGGEHPTSHVSQFPFERRRDIFTNAPHTNNLSITTIGNDVWLGRGVIVLSGVTIGDGAIIGAGAIVSKDIPAYAIAVGNPIRIIKYRMSGPQIDAVKSTKWWDMPPNAVNNLLPYFNNVDTFLAKIKETTPPVCV